ncbi:MAG: hypothetical protein OS130_07015 [Thermodesulfobacteriota bacterium]|nr:MAG: hypothetical protein OS130_07015 [Thermodesulfobacteriota bacterium]
MWSIKLALTFSGIANLLFYIFVLTSFKGAVLREANLFHAFNLEPHDLAQAKTLYHAKLVEPILQEIQERYSHLLNKP